LADALETYVQQQFGDDRDAIAAIDRLSVEVINVLLNEFVRGAGTWPYGLTDGREVELPDSFSASTTAMIAFALQLSLREVRESTLAPAVKDRPSADDKEAKTRDPKVRRRLRRVVDQFVKEIPVKPEALERQRERQGADPWFDDDGCCPPLTYSATFGWDDPLTFAWLLELLEGDTRDDARKLCRDVCDRGALLVKRVLDDPKQVLQLRRDEEVEHSFPLLRVVQLDKTISRIQGGSEDERLARSASAKEEFRARVHRLLSESQIQYSGFDPADLVFALEGLILTSPVSPEAGIVDRTFEVLRAPQEQSAYWRPQRPFKATQQGLILLPQSVEVANSLLRICASGGLDSGRYFSKYVELLDAYRRWLLGRVFRGRSQTDHGTREFVGWESEHTHRLDRIHLWQTSQVLIFMQHYAAMFRQHVARELLRLANFRPVQFAPGDAAARQHTWEAWEKSEPYRLGGPHYRVYERIRMEFIDPRSKRADGARPSYSMLLYGPPGTGKSKLAEKLSEALGYSLLTLTPSDFITSGAEGVEARAKAIFTVLNEQTDLVVLFDEIDQLLLDRESGLYRDQSDIFKLMTPGMLTKLADLAKRRSVVVILATNYFERIDRAIKRPGRFDAHYPVLPPSREPRLVHLRKMLKGLELTERQLETLADKTARFAYGELDQLEPAAKRSDKRGSALLSVLLDEIKLAPPTASLDAYVRRIEDDTSPEKPFEEFALLATIENEVGRRLRKHVQRGVLQALASDTIRDDAVRGRLKSVTKKTKR
jgi:ATPase family associated with various cellular activities (AAA)